MLIENFIELFIESAPWLLLGFTIAGLVKSFVPENWLAKHLGQPGFASTAKAALIGAPLPLCSCGVIPAAIGIRRAGASKAATTSFLISTPETGVDSISITYALLGPLMAVVRPIAAITSAITAGLLVGDDDPGRAEQSSATEKSCCKSSSTQASASQSLAERLQKGLSYTFVNLVRDIALWLLLGLALAAVIKTFVPEEFLASWGSGVVAFMVMALIGVPMYICATASTPLAAGLLFAGVSPGAVLVFLLVGPATNIATLGVVSKELGARSLFAYLGSVVGVAFAFGYALNQLVAHWQLDFAQHAEHANEIVNPGLGVASAVVLAALIVYALWGKFKPALRLAADS